MTFKGVNPCSNMGGGDIIGENIHLLGGFGGMPPAPRIFYKWYHLVRFGVLFG